MRKLFFVGCFMCFTCIAYAQQPQAIESQTTVVFRFLPDTDTFYLSVHENKAELQRLFDFVEKYKSEITSGQAPVFVKSYSNALAGRRENLNSAKIRANRVKSELIVQKGLMESNFRTTNHYGRYDGQSSAVVVEITVPTKQTPMPQPKSEPVTSSKPQPTPESKPRAEPAPAPPTVIKEIVEVVELHPIKPYSFAVRTNLLYDAFLVPTIGAEWRVSPEFGVKVDGSLAWWGSAGGDIQRMWAVSPEVRWYMGSHKSFYFGLGGNYGKYDTYGYLLGHLFPEDTGYQGTLYGGGITVGYQARLAHRLLLDLNLGLGVTHLEYDSFDFMNGQRTYKLKDQSENFWGPTQAGVSLVWTFGANN